MGYELEMQKRRERVEKWRAERKKQEIERARSEMEKGTFACTHYYTHNNVIYTHNQHTKINTASIHTPGKKWSLEDDEEEDEEDLSKQKAEIPKSEMLETIEEEKVEEVVEDEVDPLDSFMEVSLKRDFCVCLCTSSNWLNFDVCRLSTVRLVRFKSWGRRRKVEASLL